MRINSRTLCVLLVSIIATIPIQLIMLSSASAAPGSADLYVANASASYGGKVIDPTICNDGDETVIELTISIDLLFYEETSFIVLPFENTTATDAGSISQSGVWTGILASGECFQVAVLGDVTGSLGQFIAGTVTVSDSLLEGAVANIDPVSGNDSHTIVPLEIANLPDLAFSARLLTGNPVNGETVSYETTVSNVGTGVVSAGPQVILSFVVPTFASFDEVIDLDLGDSLSIDSCNDFGPPGNMGPGLDHYSGTIVVCFLDVAADLPPGTSYPFQFNMTATNDFVTGAVAVYGAVSGGDADSLRITVAMVTGNEDPLNLGVNNIVRLSYDADVLQATVSRCLGQGETTSDGTGCFRIAFNKLIYVPSFTVDDFDLGGVGSVDSLTQVDDYTWEVQVSGIAPGTTLTMLLNINGIQDYSAQQNETQVLGINTIRYEVQGESASSGSESTSAGGTLAATGVDSADWLTALLFLMVGFLLVRVSKNKEIKSVRRISL